MRPLLAFGRALRPWLDRLYDACGAIAALCLSLMNLSVETAMRLNWRFANAGITKLNIGRAGAQVVSFNEHGHLEGVPGLLTFR